MCCLTASLWCSASNPLSVLTADLSGMMALGSSRRVLMREKM